MLTVTVVVQNTDTEYR